MLGHHLTFHYCRTVSEGLPCRQILNCWHESLPIQKFIGEHFSEPEIQQFLSPPKPKMSSLMEIIQRAQQVKDVGD